MKQEKISLKDLLGFIPESFFDEIAADFGSNITDLNVEQICEVYKKRWDTEVFFRFLKQELNFTSCIQHRKWNNGNAVYDTNNSHVASDLQKNQQHKRI